MICVCVRVSWANNIFVHSALLGLCQLLCDIYHMTDFFVCLFFCQLRGIYFRKMNNRNKEGTKQEEEWGIEKQGWDRWSGQERVEWRKVESTRV